VAAGATQHARAGEAVNPGGVSGVLLELRMLLVGFLTSLLPGFHVAPMEVEAHEHRD
jgi:hypothetical protein